MFLFKGKVFGSKTVKGIRKSLYKSAQTHCGFYHPTIPAFLYIDDDICVQILFESRQSALNFQTEFEFLSTNLYYSQLLTDSDVLKVNSLTLAKRILLKDYKSDEFDSPEDTIYSQTEYTEYQPTDDIVVYQSLEKPDFLEFGSEGAHLISHAICKKKPKYGSLDKSENNRLALSRQLHGYVDGLSNGWRPVVKLNYVSAEQHPVDGRYRVVVGVEFLNQKVRGLVEPLLKSGSRNTTNPLIMECDVFVRDKLEFVDSLKHKSEETMKIWIELGYI